MKQTERADVAMVRQKLVDSREKAQAHIMAGLVYCDEKRIDKPSSAVMKDCVLTLRGQGNPFVSRGGLKLEKALVAFNANVTGAVAMDIGAATGGFTDVLLKNGARHVYAIDVGYGQLAWTLRNDSRVTVMERTNARYITQDMLPLRPTLTVMDVSFISIKLILPAAINIMGDEGRFYTLIKPQFEAGKDCVGKKGVVRDPSVHISVISDIIRFISSIGWAVTGLTYSPIKGPEGNIEFMVEIQNAMISKKPPIEYAAIENIVADAHDKL